MNIHDFNSKNALKNITYLSSDKMKGRLVGTLENQLAANYIKDEFKQSNLKPFKGDYFNKFSLTCPDLVIGAMPSLKIFDAKNNLKKEFIYGIDYREEFTNFKVNKLTFDKKSISINNGSCIIVNTNSLPVVIYPCKAEDFKHRYSFISTSKFGLYFMVSQTTFTDLKNSLQENLMVSISIPYITKDTTANNVIGMIEGKDTKSSPIIVSCHFDHVGSDLLGNIYNGALDNASGTGFVIEASKYFSTLRKPERNILFIAFNGEDCGCLGSEAFVSKYKAELKDSKVFNFDMIGSDKKIPLTILGGKNDTTSTDLIHSSLLRCSKENIASVTQFEDCSDHEAFRNNNIAALTFNDNDNSRLHSTMDKSIYISTSSIDRCFDVASKEIIKYAYNDDPFLLYTAQICFISGLCSFLLLAIVCHPFEK